VTRDEGGPAAPVRARGRARSRVTAVLVAAVLVGPGMSGEVDPAWSPTGGEVDPRGRSAGGGADPARTSAAGSGAGHRVDVTRPARAPLREWHPGPAVAPGGAIPEPPAAAVPRPRPPMVPDAAPSSRPRGDPPHPPRPATAPMRGGGELDAWRTGRPEPAPGARYAWPLTPVPTVRTPFRAPEHPYGPGHRGVDLAAQPGQAVLAAREGSVVFAGPVAGRGVVSVQHADGLRTTYEPVEPLVVAGPVIARGDVLGLLEPGHAGCPDPACLHWGVRRGHLDYLDPLVLLRPPAVRLLPVPDPWPDPVPDPWPGPMAEP
jgi:hypothetical protein